MRILIAPQEFKGSLAADEAAAAIAAGIRSVHRDWTLDSLPMSDGGPGLLDAMRRAVKADTMAAVGASDVTVRVYVPALPVPLAANESTPM